MNRKIKCPICKSSDINILDQSDSQLIIDCYNCGDLTYIEKCKKCKEVTGFEIEIVDDDLLISKLTCKKCNYSYIVD